jgi:hypothetical protein
MTMATCTTSKTDQIRTLNDAFRQSFVGGRVMMTSGVNALDDADRHALLAAVQSFEDFSPDNDPHGERDFGSIDIRGSRFFWKLDYYDLNCHGGSPDPADPAVTTRVLTIMRAEEY